MIKRKIDKEKLGEGNKRGLWKWYHNTSECDYHIQLTIKYRKELFDKEIEEIMMETMKGFKARYAIEIYKVGFDKDHVHMLLRFLPKYSGGQVIKLIKSITARKIFKRKPEIKKELWGGEFWTDGYYIATVSGRGGRGTIEKYIEKQGRHKDVEQLRLFEL